MQIRSDSSPSRPTSNTSPNPDVRKSQLSDELNELWLTVYLRTGSDLRTTSRSGAGKSSRVVKSNGSKSVCCNLAMGRRSEHFLTGWLADCLVGELAGLGSLRL